MATVTGISSTENLGVIFERLGGIDPARVRLLKPLRPATEADLIAVNDLQGSIFELVDDLLVEKGMGYTESILAMFLGGLLNAYVIPRNLGIVSGPDGMMRLFPGLVREPDVAFTSWDRVPGRKRSMAAIAGFAPDLAIEILSPSNTKAEMTRKRDEYFRAGVRLVWEIDPRSRTVSVYATPEAPTRLQVGQELDGGNLLPGFILPLADLFAELDRQGG